MVLSMAKNKPADNQFTVGEKYLARIIAARWNSLPTVGRSEPTLTIQVKLSILCTVPPVGEPILCGLEAVIFIPVTIKQSPRLLDDTSVDQATPRISDVAHGFLNDLGISWPQYPVSRTLVRGR